MARTDRLIVALLEQLREAFNNEAKPPRGGVTGPPQLRAGDGIPALDNFGKDCALLFVNVTRRYRTTSFPEATVSTARCGAAMAVELQIGVARCSQALTHTGGLPSAEVMAAEFATQEDDADRLDAVLCRLGNAAEDADLIHDWLPTGTDVLGPEGGTVAVIAQAVFHLAR
ncbi:hypothetical protein K3888_13270 [Dietzia aurantiaca]|uniref:hypothetical protein n=1 Tax=Dietzia aurantiaca TaxID=983873 RepID=UPI001E397ABB|nr:hypothetical protein [Dietzia aurantiaca]MCD2263670.1 hypothetical protein [Dietzia aurantiaca]